MNEAANRVIPIPKWWEDILPKDEVLDGELYWDKDHFYETMGILRGDMSVWPHVKYYLFDVFMENMPFSARLARLRQIHEGIVQKWKELDKSKYPELRDMACPVVYHKQNMIESWPRAFEVFQQWIREGEEGAMLKNPISMYKQGRSYDMLKWKVKHEREAVVVGYNVHPKTGRLQSLQCVWDVSNNDYYFNDRPDISIDPKQVFSVSGGLNGELRDRYEVAFPVGKVIRLSYYEMTYNDKPVSGVIVM
jgi:ATP-dependent DNA ligase